MADNLTTQSATPATIPDSTVIATDDAGAGGHVQLVKLASPAGGSAAAWGDATDGLPVELTNTSVATTTAKGTTAFTDPACDTSADLILAANANRKSAIIQNVGTVDCFVGPSGVTTSTGLSLPAGASLVDDASTSAWYGITASGTADLRVCEVA